MSSDDIDSPQDVPADPAAPAPAASGDGASDPAPDDPAAPESARPTSARRPGSAAARARRIGGRAAVRRPGESAAGAAAGNDPVSLTKTASSPDVDDATDAEPDATDAELDATDAEPDATDPELDAPDSGDEPTAELPAPPAEPAASPTGRASSALVRWIPAAVLVVAVIVMAVVVAVSTHGTRWAKPGVNTVRDQVLAASKQCVVATNTYSYKDLDGFEKKGLACATGKFATQFKSSVEKILRKSAPPVEQVQSLQVNTAGLIDVGRNNQWDVLIYGQIKVANTSVTGSRLDPFGAVAHMIKVNGNWRISSLCSQSLGGSTDACY